MKQNKITSVLNIAVITTTVLFIYKNYVPYFRQCVGNDLRVLGSLFPIEIALFGIFTALSYIISIKRKSNKNHTGILFFFAGIFTLLIGVFTSYFMHTLAPALLIQTSVLIASYGNVVFHFASFALLGGALGEQLSHKGENSVVGIAVGAVLAMILDFAVAAIGFEIIFVVLGVVTILISLLSIASKPKIA